VRPLDADIQYARALVVDPSPGSRATLVAMLRDGGVGRVEQCAHVADARRVLASRHFHIVLCEHEFPGEPMTGQDLIDELRLSHSLSLSTVVIMISGEAAYSRVADAAEAALDAYLIKPHTEDALRQRLADARARKRQLKPILDKVEQRDYESAAELCRSVFEVRGPQWIHAARIGAELYLNLGQAHAAIEMLEAVLATRALPWARMGIARSQYRSGSLASARRTLESLLADQPGYVDAYDVMGRVLLDQGDSEAALSALERACALTPGNVARLQKFGVLSFYCGDPARAAQALQRATEIGLSSRTYDLQGLVLLAALQFDRRDARQLALTRTTMARVAREAPGSARLQRFVDVVDTLHLLATRAAPEAILRVRAMFGALHDPQFDFEAACNLVMLLSRLERTEVHLEDLPYHIERLALRFSVSKTANELLVQAAGDVGAIVGVLRQCHARIGAMAEAALSHTISGRPAQAITDLLAGAEQTLNGKLIELAGHTLARHQAAITDAQALHDRIDALKKRYLSYGTQIPLTRPGERV